MNSSDFSKKPDINPWQEAEETEGKEWGVATVRGEEVKEAEAWNKRRGER